MNLITSCLKITYFSRDNQRDNIEGDDAFEALFRQQTVVAAILRHDSETDELEVASLGVGTKFLSSDGDFGEGGARVADMHAEALCQAAFVRYLASAYRGG